MMTSRTHKYPVVIIAACLFCSLGVLLALWGRNSAQPADTGDKLANLSPALHKLEIAVNPERLSTSGHFLTASFVHTTEHVHCAAATCASSTSSIRPVHGPTVNPCAGCNSHSGRERARTGMRGHGPAGCAARCSTNSAPTPRGGSTLLPAGERSCYGCGPEARPLRPPTPVPLSPLPGSMSSWFSLLFANVHFGRRERRINLHRTSRTHSAAGSSSRAAS